MARLERPWHRRVRGLQLLIQTQCLTSQCHGSDRTATSVWHFKPFPRPTRAVDIYLWQDDEFGDPTSQRRIDEHMTAELFYLADVTISYVSNQSGRREVYVSSFPNPGVDKAGLRQRWNRAPLVARRA